MSTPYFITALCTPLDENEDLHVAGLERHVQDQQDHDIDGLLVGGTMGAMQLLKDSTYRELVQKSVEFNKGRAELMVGVGDTSLARTRDRIRMVEDLPIDALVVVTPFCIKFRQPELVHYFESLADLSPRPIYLYDLPQMTGSKVEVDTVLKLARHPNIHGIKCSDHLVTARPLMDAGIEGFRVILAQPLLMDMLLHSGVREHLDGVYGLVPHWMNQMKQAAINSDWATVEQVQRDLAALLKALIEFPAPLFASANELLRLRGVSGFCAPAPIRPLTPEQQAAFSQVPIVQKLIAESPSVLVTA